MPKMIVCIPETQSVLQKHEWKFRNFQGPTRSRSLLHIGASERPVYTSAHLSDTWGCVSCI
jgi:hypothetical protein